jgi:hypothetical protein
VHDCSPSKIVVYDLIGSCGKSRPILPRSLHLPLASTGGNATRNPNKTGVRFWTEDAGNTCFASAHAEPLLRRKVSSTPRTSSGPPDRTHQILAAVPPDCRSHRRRAEAGVCPARDGRRRPLGATVPRLTRPSSRRRLCRSGQGMTRDRTVTCSRMQLLHVCRLTR